MEPSLLKVGQEVQLYIEKLSFSGGRGIAKNLGPAVFVENTAPDEWIRAQVTFVKKNFAEAKLIEILKPSPHRRIPLCPVASICGGCSIQHVVYPVQLQQKEEILKGLLRPLAALTAFEFRGVLPSPKEWEYRNRAQFHQEKNRLGFLQRKSHRIVDIQECPVVEPEINKQLKELRNQGPFTGARRRVELHSSTLGKATFFSQVNSEQNRVLQNLVVEASRNSAFEEIWDLYGGAGNFAFPLSEAYPDKSISCVEFSSSAVEFGKQRKVHQTQLHFFNMSTEDFLKNQIHKSRWIVLDPPRAGLSPEALNSLLPYLSESHLLYISCDPSTFTRDALVILKNSPLKLRWVQGLDMFPQTDHIETLSLFS